MYVQVFALTGSPAQVGLLGVSGLIGSFAGVFIAGSFIDAHDRRGVLIWTQVGHIGVSGVLVAGLVGEAIGLRATLGLGGAAVILGAVSLAFTSLRSLKTMPASATLTLNG